MDLTPLTADDVVAAIAEARAAKRPLVPVGGGTLIESAGVETSGVRRLSTVGFAAVEDYEPADLTCTVGAGVTLAALQRALAVGGQRLPVWHPAAEAATIGGLVAFGWTGLGRRLYGPLRDRVLEVRLVTGAGRAVRGGGRVVKNVTGFDLPRLFCGSRGTLGVITGLTLKVHPVGPPLYGAHRPGMVPPGGIERIARLRDGRWESWGFAPGPPADAESVCGAPVTEAEDAFGDLAADPVLCPLDGGAGVVVRTAVPPSCAAELVSQVDGSTRAVVDVASGVAWARLPDAGHARRVRTFAEEAGGTCVVLQADPDVRAEIGTWGAPPQGLEIMQRLKASFDPDGVLPALR